MKELSKNKVAEYTGIKLKELNKLQKENIEMFESIMLGSTILSNDYEIGEVMFRLRHKIKPEVSNLIDENNKLRSKVEELENALLSLGADLENVLKS